MGLPGVVIVFNGPAPSFSDLCAEASDYGGMLVVWDDVGQATAKFSFEMDAKYPVTVHFSQRDGFFICDYTMLAPVLYQLLWEVLVKLGGTPVYPYERLRLPISKRSIVRARARIHMGSSLMLFLLIAVPTGVVVALWKLVAKAL